MGNGRSKNPNHSKFIQKINRRRTKVSKRFTSNIDNPFFKKNKLKLFILKQLEISFPKRQHQSKEFLEIHKIIKKAKNHHLVSTFSLLHLEKDMFESMGKERDLMLRIEGESTQYSKTMLRRDKTNIFWSIMKSFDYIIAKRYHLQLLKIFEKTCKQCKFKKMDFEGMLRAMINVPDSGICSFSKDDFESEEYQAKLKLAEAILLQILESVKYLGLFLTRIMYQFYSKKSEVQQKKTTQNIFQMCVIFNSLFRSKFAFYCYAIYLSRIIISKNKRIWLTKRQKAKSSMTTFDDLVYLNRFLVDEESQNYIRSFSVQLLRTSTHSRNIQKFEKMAPKGIHSLLKSALLINQSDGENELDSLISGTETKANTIPALQMDANEFLVHLNLHFHANLDFIFSSSLKEILKFFTHLEEFMETTFGKKELEIKIDLMRLIIRMTNACLFVDKIYLLYMMKLSYLSYWQTFSLFTQVLLTELDITKLSSSSNSKRNTAAF